MPWGGRETNLISWAWVTLWEFLNRQWYLTVSSEGCGVIS